MSTLTLEEKGALTSGEDMLSTVAVERLGIPKVRVTDGPNGARGNSLPGMGGAPSACIPCGSALGATWNPALVEALGALVGREARDRGCRGLLAPTVNLHRSPLAGRNFECYSEDPLLSGRLAAGYVRGVQSEGVFATVKHFVGNDAEFERASISSVIDERSLRELYLVPFEIAVSEGGALAIMTAYNRLNGRWLTQQPEFLLDILRDEWGFEGLVMTDWFAVTDTKVSLGAGLDLEMPGPARGLGSTVVDAVKNGDVDEADLEAAVSRLLGGLDRIGALDGPAPGPDPKAPTPADKALLRRAAAEATVLLSNDGVLPLAPTVARIALLGAPAQTPTIMGGGSAQVTPHHVETVVDALARALGPDRLPVYERGCESTQSPMVVGGPVLRAPDGFVAETYAGLALEGPVTETQRLTELRMMKIGMSFEPSAGDWSMRVSGTVVPEETGIFQLALAQAGLARLLVNDEVVLDGFTNRPPPGGNDFFGQASQDLLADVHFEKGVPVDLVVEYAFSATSLAGFRVGFRTSDGEALLARAVTAAAEADVAVVCVGTSAETETEGRDRTTLALPGRQAELVRRVAAVNPRTVVVVNAAAPVDMEWAQDVGAVLQCWFGGQEMAGGLVDVLVGTADPGGRLPTTLPMRLEHAPSHANFPGENGEVRYGEGLFMGYRGYEHNAIAPRFPFGHGLTYTSFDLGVPTLSTTTHQPGGTVTVRVPVANVGSRAGSEVVQCYVAPGPQRLARPPKELKAFGKVVLDPGESTEVEFVLDDRAFAYWDPGQDDWNDVQAFVPDMFNFLSPPAPRRLRGWQVDAGSYEILIGRSSDDIAHRCTIQIPDVASGS
ncbi:MAG TPA: glycoside hydrolase family 3 C-terminal domain-containing protein [Acidimicrobiales bacterium]|nr:glycoside hydrolase family 3 C-terminal domain-containing protein [Acidimicrobiales bacterium]